MQSYASRAVKGFAVVFVINIFAAFLGYLIRIVLARNLTVAEYGLFFSVFTLINFLAIFNTLGLDQALVKFIPEFVVKKNYPRIKSAIAVSLLSILCTIIILGGLLLVFSKLLAQYYFKTSLAIPVLILFILILFFSSLRTLLRSIYQGFQKMGIYAGMYLAENALILILLLWLFAFGKNLFIAIYAHIAAYVLICILFFLFSFRTFRFFKQKINGGKAVTNSESGNKASGKKTISKTSSKVMGGVAKQLFGFGIPVVIGSVGGTAILYIDTLVLTYFRSLQEVGVYNVIVPTVMMLQFFATSIATVIFPMVSELWTRKMKKFLELGVKMLYQYFFVILLPLTLIVFYFSRFILMLFFGAEYVVGTATMQILVIAILFLSLGSIVTPVFSGIGKPKIPMKIILQAAIINLVLNLILIPSFGMIGAAISSLAAYFYFFIMCILKLRKFMLVEIPWLKWLKTLIAGMIMLLVILLLEKHLIFGQLLLGINIYLEALLICIIGGIVYILLALAMKIIDFNEIKILVKSFV